MQLNELGDYIEGQFDFPVDVATVRDRIGDERIDSEDEDGGLTIASILENQMDIEFTSPLELHQTILGELPEEYIGRKYYDDRGSNPLELRDGPGGTGDESL